MSGGTTKNVLDAVGSQVYEQTIVAMRQNESLSRVLLDSSLATLGINKKDLTIDDLGMMLPEIDTRLRQFIEAEEVHLVMKRILQMILAWGEPS